LAGTSTIASAGAFRVIYVAKFAEAVYYEASSGAEAAAMSEELRRVRGSANVFADLGFDKAEVENLKPRSELMMRVEDFFRRSGMTQPRCNALLKGKACAWW
jgi:hypothetical protein